MTANYNELLGYLDLRLGEEQSPGLVATKAESRQQLLEAGGHTAELVALERAAQLGADHVYFRREAGKPSMPVAWFFDRCGGLAGRDEEDWAALHRRVWSAGDAPLSFVLRPTRVDVFHILKGPRMRAGQPVASPWQQFDLSAEREKAVAAMAHLSARRMDDGRLWELHPDRAELEVAGAAFMALAQELENCRLELEEHGLPEPVVKRLLILFVLVQYLDERRDAEGRGVFPEGTFAQFAPGALSFVDLLLRGAGPTIAFLDTLAAKDRLNGQVFALNTEERQHLRNGGVERFAELLEGKTESSGQRLLWRRYAFSVLPVELISHLYEQFLPRQPGVVYTPPFLVQLILDEVMPLDEPTPPDFRVLDPASGSGVFLVGAFKRLVQRWRRANSMQAPTVEILQTLLRNSIRGVDIEPEAVRLTLFSLSVALCDFLQPRVIWEELHFEELVGKTVRCGDFFDLCESWEAEGAGTFDLVIGNPPFESKLSSAGRATSARLRHDDPSLKIPDKQVALLFLEAAMRVARRGARIGLLQSAAPLLYNDGSAKFRTHFLARYRVPLLVDLTMQYEQLFRRGARRSNGGTSEHKNPGRIPVVVVVAENRAPEGSAILHATVRRTLTSDLKLGIEIDTYDLHEVSHATALTQPTVWKSNLVGGGRIARIVAQLANKPTLGDFLDRMKKERDWDSGEGFIQGNPERSERRAELEMRTRIGETLEADEMAELRALRKNYKEAGWLTGHRAVDSRSFRASEQAPTLNEEPLHQEYFAGRRRPALFEGPVLLIKEALEVESGQVPTYLSREDVCFKANIFGVSGPEEDLTRLQALEELIRSPLLPFHFLATSGVLGVSRMSHFQARDLRSLPVADDSAASPLTELETVIAEDVVRWTSDMMRSGPRSQVYQTAESSELRSFGQWFCRVLGSVYSNLRPGRARVSGDAVAFPFWFGEPTPTLADEISDDTALQRLLTHHLGAAVRTRRVVRLFTCNAVIFVKPNQRRYWLRSIAIRDADEAFAHLQASGY